MTKNILVVDDSESIRELVSSTLESAGYGVSKSVNGKEGLKSLRERKNQLALIITDLFMPIMDGIELIKAVRKEKDHRYTPILMLTTESHIDKQIEGKKAGATGWMVKPFDQKELLKIVHRIIR